MIHLQQARSWRKLTQKQLADRCGLHPSILSRIEGGQREATLSEAERLGEALHLPLEWLITGKEHPGNSLADMAMELWHLGIIDLIVPKARVPGAFRPAEELLALAVGREQPDARVLEALPSVLAWNRLRPGLLEAFAQATHPRALTRLAWLAEITLLVERTSGFPGGLLSADDLMDFLGRVDRPNDLDAVGHSGEPVPEHRAWKYWRITYPSEIASFRERAERLLSLREGKGRIMK